MMRTWALLSIAASILAVLLVTSCSQSESKISNARPTATPTGSQASVPVTSRTSTPSVPQTPAPPFPQSRNLPPTAGDRPTAAEFKGYTYSYKKDGPKTDAIFGPRLLPPDRDLATGAVADVVERSYGDKVVEAPRLIGSGAERTVRVAGKKHQYLVVPVTEPTGEVHSLIITQLD